MLHVIDTRSVTSAKGCHGFKSFTWETRKSSGETFCELKMQAVNLFLLHLLILFVLEKANGMPRRKYFYKYNDFCFYVYPIVLMTNSFLTFKKEFDLSLKSLHMAENFVIYNIF